MEQQFDVFAFAGQSNADGHFYRRDGDNSVPLGREVFQQEIFEQTGVQADVLNVSSPGSGSNNNVVTPFTTGTNFWWNLETDSPGPLLNAAIANIRAGLQPGQDLDGLIWAQGEEDADAIFYGANANATIADLITSTTAIFETFRAEFGEDLPIFVQELGNYPPTTQGTANGFELVRDAQLSIIESDDNIYLAADADADGVTILDDNIHVSTEGLGVLAEQLADTVVEVISEEGGETVGTSGADTLIGTAGSDIISGLQGNDVIEGGAGADILNGNNGSDSISGGSGADIINGGNGDDIIGGYNGADTLIGGAGNDLLFGDAGNDTFVFAEGSGYDTVADFEIGADKIDISDFGFSSFDQLNLVGQNNSVFLIIDESTSIELSDVTAVNQLSAIDFIFADVANGDTGSVDDNIVSPNEDGVFSGTNGNDVIIGTPGDDIIQARSGEDIIDGGAGNDNIRAGAGDDNVAGGTGDDIINGRNGNDYISGDAGSDTFLFEQNSGYDTIADFEAGTDKIDVSAFGISSFNELNLVDNGSSVSVYLDENTSAELLGIGNLNQLSARDFIFAEASEEAPNVVIAPVTSITTADPANPVAPVTTADGAIIGTNGADTFNGGNGADIIFGGAGADNIRGNGGNDDLNGGNGADDVRGGAGNDLVAGGNGHDELHGGANEDVIGGGAGNDTIYSGRGNDIVFGDEGDDTFVITVGTGFDTIADFETGNDKIDLSAFDFDRFNDLNIVEQNNSVFIFIDENTSVELSNIDDADDLSADDFIL